MTFDFTNFSLLLPILLALFLAIALIFVILNFLRIFFSSRKYTSHHIFSVKLPKEKPNDEDKTQSNQSLKEEISKGEAIFAAIGGMSAQRGFKSWLSGRNDHISFEIVADSKHITFYFACSQEDVRYLEQQIQAHYPAAVIEEVQDYNSFGLNGEVAAAYLKTIKDFVFPLKTYQKMDVDPMNSLINVLSKLEKGENLAIQYLVRSAKRSWHAKVRRVVSAIHHKNSVSLGLKSSHP